MTDNYILYDGDCPVCAHYLAMSRLRSAASDFGCIDARTAPALVAEWRQSGYEINDGLIVQINGRILYGAEATRFLTGIARPASLYARFLIWSVGAAPWSRALYPLLVVARKLLLRLQGRGLIA